jgi:hypothetical protein
MSTTNDADALTRLREIPNVGPAIARRLAELGFDGVASLRGQDPEEPRSSPSPTRATPGPGTRSPGSGWHRTRGAPERRGVVAQRRG